MIDSFRDRLLSDLTELIPAVNEPPRAVMPPEPPRARGRSRLMLVTAATAAAAVGAALGLTMLGGPAGSTPAWAIERSPNGDVLVTVHEVDDLARLQRDLRAAGVPAVVRAGSHSCAVWSVQPQPGIADVLRADVRRANNDHFWRIDPGALKPGDFLAFLITRYPIRQPDTALDGRYVVQITAYQIIVAATNNPSCAPLPGR